MAISVKFSYFLRYIIVCEKHKRFFIKIYSTRLFFTYTKNRTKNLAYKKTTKIIKNIGLGSGDGVPVKGGSERASELGHSGGIVLGDGWFAVHDHILLILVKRRRWSGGGLRRKPGQNGV